MTTPQFDSTVWHGKNFNCYCILRRNHSCRLIHLTFSLQKHEAAVKLIKKELPDVYISTGHWPDAHIKTQLSEYNNGSRKKFNIPMDTYFIDKGTDFQKKVWRKITEIPYGVVKTYGEIAKEMGGINLSRAVGGACNRNPIALVIPCHRVVGTHSLGGFAGGSDIKQTLLDIEIISKNNN